MKNFNVGDRVKLINASSAAYSYNALKVGAVGTIRFIDNNSICVEWDNWHDGHGGEADDLNIPNYAAWYVHKSSLQLLSTTTYPIITIQTDGKTTTATLREGHKILNTAKAVCCEEDEFSYFTGAKLALERVMEKKEKQEEKKFEIGMRVTDDTYSFDWGYVTHIREEDKAVFITPLDCMSDFLINGAREHSNCFLIDEDYSTILKNKED